MRYRASVLITLGIVALMFASAIGAWTHAGTIQRIAVHFMLNGEPNGWMRAPMGWFVLPFFTAITAALLLALPHVSPRLERSAKQYGLTCIFVIGMMAVAQSVIVAPAFGLQGSMSRALTLTFGLVLAVMGNLLGKIRQNSVFGIRTPWTLRDEWVWDQTHRFGGRVFVIAGIALMIAAFAQAAGTALFRTQFLIVLMAAILPCIKSYFLWREKKSDGRPPGA